MFFNQKLNWPIILLLAVLAIIFITQNKSTYAEAIKEDGLLLMRTLQQENVDLDRILLTNSGSVHSGQEANEVKSFKNKIEQAFSIKLVQTSDSGEEGLIKYEGEGTLPTAPSIKLRIVWVGVDEDASSKYNTYLVVSLLSEGVGKAGYLEGYAYLKEALRFLSLEPTIRINIQGSVNQKLSHDAQEEKIMRMFQQLKGSVKEGLNEEEVISLTGFSNQLNYTLSSNGNPINVQIASRYDHRSNKTMFTIGTPVITIEY